MPRGSCSTCKGTGKIQKPKFYYRYFINSCRDKICKEKVYTSYSGFKTFQDAKNFLLSIQSKDLKNCNKKINYYNKYITELKIKIKKVAKAEE